MTGVEIIVCLIVAVALIEISPAILGILLLIFGLTTALLFVIAETLQRGLHAVIYWLFGIK